VITKEKILQAYAKIGLSPDADMFINHDRTRCCPVSALVLAGPDPNWEPGNSPEDYEAEIQAAATKLKEDASAVRGLAAGIDGMAFRPGKHFEPTFLIGQELAKDWNL
jgi:hypothetical protein